jgi:hypothetical protein
MMPTAFDAWVLARLIVDQPLNGELAAMSATFRPLAERLAATTPDHRPPFIDGYSLRLPDPAAFLKAVALADRDSPAPTADAADPVGPRAKLIRADGILARPVEWLWRGRIPLGMLTLFAGDPKLGKSFATVAVAAAVSRGAPMPDGDPPEGPGSVILMSAEDDPARTIVPRLKTAHAELARVHILESVILADGSEAWPSLAADLATIEAAAARLDDCRLIVVDPVSAYLGGLDDHRNAELRGMLAPLKGLAERLNVAVILVTHLSKSGGTNAKHRVIGSIAYVGACRANFLFARDRDDPSGRRVLMLDNGGNLARAAPTLAYVIEDRGDGPHIEWLADPVAITAEQALAAEQASCQADRDAPERREAEAWLREVLSAGPVSAKEIESAARNAGITRMTLRRAKESIGAESVREGFGKDSTCSWRLPNAANH